MSSPGRLPPDVAFANEVERSRPRIGSPRLRSADRVRIQWNSHLSNIPFNLIGVTVQLQILPGNPARDYFLIQNKSAVNLWVSFGSEASTASGVLIGASGYYEPYRPPNTAIYVYGPGAYGVIVDGS